MLILVTGGSRSGKSGFAVEMASRHPAPRLFLATARASDEEMERRIATHRAARPPGWRLLEEPVRVPQALSSALESSRTVVLDCVTLWMSNLLLAAGRFDETEAESRAEALLDAARTAPSAPGHTGDAERVVIVVTNEVGSGIVPETALGRRFRDCAGRANQVIARGADEVYLMVSGIAIRIKPAGTSPWVAA